MLHKKKTDPIVMCGEVFAIDYRMETNPKHDTMEPNNTQESTSNNATSVIRSSTRPKKPPNTMLKDFLW
jgi:hypothetical protein